MVERRKLFGGLGNALFQYAYIYAQARSGAIPDIYVQDPKFFIPYQEEIRQLYLQGVEPIDMVSVHIRRGDYLRNPHYVDLNDTDYYEKALEHFPDSKFLIFCADRQEGSDDIADMEWCRQKFQGDQFEFYQGNNEIDDFNMMAGCCGHIIANSSFSWWAAYVGGQKTVAPTKWFASGKAGIPLLDYWIKI